MKLLGNRIVGILIAVIIIGMSIIAIQIGSDYEMNSYSNYYNYKYCFFYCGIFWGYGALVVFSIIFGIMALAKKNKDSKFLKSFLDVLKWLLIISLIYIAVFSSLIFINTAIDRESYRFGKELEDVSHPNHDKAAKRLIEEIGNPYFFSHFESSIPYIDYYKYLIIREQAEKGDKKAQGILGVYYIDESGRTGNIERGLYWLIKSAHNGLSEAQYVLGIIYSDSSFKNINDINKSIFYLSQAANAGIEQSYYPLGKLLYNLQEINKAKIIWEKGAKIGDEDCLCELERLEFLN